MTAEDKRAAALEFEESYLPSTQTIKHSRYQIRFCAKMIANGGYSDLDTPPAGAAMFHHETAMEHAKPESYNDILMSGMPTHSIRN